jgi:hypothetical protein
LDLCLEYEQAINTYIRKGDWLTWVSFNKGQVTLPIFQSLEAFWPGMLVYLTLANMMLAFFYLKLKILLGKVEDAARIMLTYSQV